jgi:hypothetical protein
MIQQSSQDSYNGSHYPGVLCLHCRQVIPLPASVARLKDESSESRETLGQPNLTVFTLRCGGCQKEAPYHLTETIEFDGVPVPSGAHARPRSMAWRLRSMAKASGS